MLKQIIDRLRELGINIVDSLVLDVSKTIRLGIKEKTKQEQVKKEKKRKEKEAEAKKKKCAQT